VHAGQDLHNLYPFHYDVVAKINASLPFTFNYNDRMLFTLESRLFEWLEQQPKNKEARMAVAIVTC